MTFSGRGKTHGCKGGDRRQRRHSLRQALRWCSSLCCSCGETRSPAPKWISQGYFHYQTIQTNRPRLARGHSRQHILFHRKVASNGVPIGHPEHQNRRSEIIDLKPVPRKHRNFFRPADNRARIPRSRLKQIDLLGAGVGGPLSGGGAVDHVHRDVWNELVCRWVVDAVFVEV